MEEKRTNGPWRTRTGHAEDRRWILRKCDGVHRNVPKRAGTRQSARCKDIECIVKSDLPLNKMAPFSSSLLALSPTPEPVMRPTSPAKGAGSPVQEVPETEQQKLLRSWVALLQALDTQVKIIPGDGPKLFEDRETWMRGWSQLSVQLTESATIAEHLKMELEFDNVGRTILEEGKCTYRIFSKEIREIKERAVMVSCMIHKRCDKEGIFSQQTFFSATKHVLRRLIQHTKWHCYKQADSTHQMALLGLQKVYKEPNFAM
ncbi:hypothetical protein F4604DRAFT_1685084 [Suillus subluteus]|nr:hypothetical protein F4604DRAFT_1685084 [Suillus subluteus]